MIPASVRIFVYAEPVDMRRGFDGLARIARESMGHDPQSGSLFVFTNRRANRLKALWWDRNGYCILYKRAHRAVFEIPVEGRTDAASVRIDGRGLAQMLAGVAKERKRRPKLRVVR